MYRKPNNSDFKKNYKCAVMPKNYKCEVMPKKYKLSSFSGDIYGCFILPPHQKNQKWHLTI